MSRLILSFPGLKAQILKHLARDWHLGSKRVIRLIDSFELVGPNGYHNVLVLEVMGPSPSWLRDGNKGENAVWRQASLVQL